MANVIAAVDARIALEIPWNRRRRNVLHSVALRERRIELELLRVGREHQQPAGREYAHARIDQIRVIAAGVEHAFHGSFHEVSPARLVQTFTYEGSPDSVALETLWFEDLGGGRTRLHAQSLVDSFEGRDAFLNSGMETGVEQGYRKLDALLAAGV